MELKRRKHRYALRQLFLKMSLEEVTRKAVNLPLTADGDRLFAGYQRERLQATFEGLKIEYVVVSSIKTDATNTPVDIQSVLLDLPPETLESYFNVIEFDELSPFVYANPGRVCTLSTVVSQTRLPKHEFYRRHMRHFGMKYVTSIGFLRPAHRTVFITFDYIGGPKNTGWTGFDHSRMDLASFPFALAWMMRRGAIDAVELERCMTTMADLTEHQLQNIRKFVNSPSQTFPMMARDLGIKPGTLKDDLYRSRDIIEKRFPSDHRAGEDNSSRAPLRSLLAHMQFFTMLGDQTRELVRPDDTVDEGRPLAQEVSEPMSLTNHPST